VNAQTNQNGGDLAGPLGASLAAAEVELRVSRRVAMTQAAEPWIGTRWAAELASTVCAVVETAHMAGDDPGLIEDVIAAVVQGRLERSGAYTGWKQISFATGVKIVSACVDAWKGAR
jgi:hypothetical protein